MRMSRNVDRRQASRQGGTKLKGGVGPKHLSTTGHTVAGVRRRSIIQDSVRKVLSAIHPRWHGLGVEVAATQFSSPSLFLRPRSTSPSFFGSPFDHIDSPVGW